MEQTPVKKRSSSLYFSKSFKPCLCGSKDVKQENSDGGLLKVVCKGCGKETMSAKTTTTIRGYWNKLNMPK